MNGLSDDDANDHLVRTMMVQTATMARLKRFEFV